jgi:hypothetical protein
VLVTPGVLVQHPLREEHEHQQADGERRLDHHQRSQQQGHDLQRPTKDRQACAEEPASTPDQVPSQCQAQMLLVGRLLGVHSLEGDP